MLLKTKCAAWRLFLPLMISLFAGNSVPSNAAYYFHVKDELSNEDLNSIKYLLDAYYDKINIRDLRIFKHSQFSVIRIANNNLCEHDFCINIVVRKCTEIICKSTTVMASDKFQIRRIPRDDLGLMLQFPTRVEDNYTSVIVNNRYVAALQGL